ncbi:hypothetical protein F5Y19DRAFT_456803 [Xylariaceae sp. FL1651]|nr:hypothetical protein F5Y19DRAFT_456803 [Xylariaceae sp. FL1651]
MFNALTLHHPDLGDWTSLRRLITWPDGSISDLETWGWYIVGPRRLVLPRFQTYDEGLRILIARCMAQEDEDRPELNELIEIIEDLIADGDQEADQIRAADEAAGRHTAGPFDVTAPPNGPEEDDLLWKFYQDYLFQPPDKPDLYGAALNAPASAPALAPVLPVLNAPGRVDQSGNSNQAANSGNSGNSDSS